LTGIALLGAAVATIGSRLVQAEIDAVQTAKKESRKRLLQIYDHMPDVITNIRRASNKSDKKVLMEAKKHLASIPLPQFPPGLVTFWKTARWIIQSLTVVALGGMLVGRLEGWSFLNSIYYSLITGE
jgi:hypothetical protein